MSFNRYWPGAGSHSDNSSNSRDYNWKEAVRDIAITAGAVTLVGALVISAGIGRKQAVFERFERAADLDKGGDVSYSEWQKVYDNFGKLHNHLSEPENDFTMDEMYHYANGHRNSRIKGGK